MFFHIDESGNTGNNLFDAQQPTLSYGLLSSRTNVDVLGRSLHKAMLKTAKVDVLHGAELGIERLEVISPLLIELQDKMRFDFDYYFIEKPTYALVHLFEAIYDAGLNDAVAWVHYWTPMRFYLIRQLAELVDESFLQKSWDLCTTKRIAARFDEVVALLADLKQRIADAPLNARSKEILSIPLDFGIKHPDKLDFGSRDARIVSPNAVAFQFVVAAMARQLRKKRVTQATAITIDRQEQFNTAQFKTHEAQRLIAQGLKKAPAKEQALIVNHPLYAHLAGDEIFGRAIPTRKPTVSRSSQSIGLQIVDAYLWVASAVVKRIPLAEGVSELASRFMRRTQFDGIWMGGMMERLRRFEAELPKEDELTEQQKRQAVKMLDDHRGRIAALGI